MGRRIPSSKKHKKTKSIDPFYNGERKKLLEKSQGKFDLPPKDISEQEIPKKLKELMEIKNQISTGQFKEKKSNSKLNRRKLESLRVEVDDLGPLQPGMKNPIKPVRVLTKRPGESDRHFVRRVEKMADNVVEETELQDKLEASAEKQSLKEAKAEKRTKLNSEEELRLPMIGNERDAKKISEKKIRLKLKEKEKKEAKKYDKIDEFDALKDDVRFGEVVMEPPNLHFKPLKTDKQPLATKSLILKNMFTTTKPDDFNNLASEFRKRKALSEIEKLKLEKEREFAVNEYKRLKKLKSKLDENKK